MTEDSLEIFLSYRRDDSSGFAGRLHDALQAKFGEERVFMDVATIEPGLDFLEAIKRAIERCDVFLPIIGRQWISVEDGRGRRRLDSATDPVRLETKAALERKGLRIVPILVDGASMPSVEELPDEIARLSTRTAHELSHSRWRYDVAQLIALLEKIRGQINTVKKNVQTKTDGERKPRKFHTWDEYRKYTPHSSEIITLVRDLATQISEMTPWRESLTTNQVRFRDQRELVVALQFWQADAVRLHIPLLNDRPDPDPFPHYRGVKERNGGWTWYVPTGAPAPDIGGVIDLIKQRRPESQEARTRPRTGDRFADTPASDSSRTPAAEFEQGMYSAYEYLKKSHGYNASYFLQLLREHGGVGAAKRLLQISGSRHSDGFLRLVELNQLESSVEANALRPQYRELFADLELAEARRRLQAAGFDVNRWEDRPWQ